MSFDSVMEASKENPALAEELKNAKAPEERAAILTANGIEIPTDDSKFHEMDGGVGSGAEGITSVTLICGQ